MCFKWPICCIPHFSLSTSAISLLFLWLVSLGFHSVWRQPASLPKEVAHNKTQQEAKAMATQAAEYVAHQDGLPLPQAGNVNVQFLPFSACRANHFQDMVGLPTLLWKVGVQTVSTWIPICFSPFLLKHSENGFDQFFNQLVLEAQVEANSAVAQLGCNVCQVVVGDTTHRINGWQTDTFCWRPVSRMTEQPHSKTQTTAYITFWKHGLPLWIFASNAIFSWGKPLPHRAVTLSPGF